MSLDFAQGGQGCRPGERQIRGEVRRGSLQTMTDLENIYAGVSMVVRNAYEQFFRQGKRLPELAVRRMPAVIGRHFESCGSALKPIDLKPLKRRSSPSALWMQPHLLDDNVPSPIYYSGLEAGAVHGSGLYSFVFAADRRHFVCIDREPPFLSIQRHAFERYALRRRLPPEHVLTTLAAEILPLSALAMAQLIAHSKVASQSLYLRLVLPLQDGLVLGDFHGIMPHKDCAHEPFGTVITADRTGLRKRALLPHGFTFLPNPDRHVCALIRTAVPNDMLRDSQERFRRALQAFLRRHAAILRDLESAIWLHDLLASGDCGDAEHPLNPAHYREMINELASLLASEDGLDVARDRRKFTDARDLTASIG
jgi:hypothetical protein